jgi:Virulence-associated protein E-like domain/Domain of unknown function (DUF6371)
MIIPNNEQLAIFGTNEGAWEYRTFDNEFLCYIVRYEPKNSESRKSYSPFIFINNEWTRKWFTDADGNTIKAKPLYGLHKLKLYPNKPVLLVEGEKTADAGQELFSDYNVLGWMGGAGTAKNVDIGYLKDKLVYLLPDNDDNGYKAMETFKKRLNGLAKCVYLIDIGSLSIIPKKWDLADFEEGIIDLEDLKQLFIQESSKIGVFPDLSEKERPLNTTDNIAHLLNHYHIKIRYNLMTNSAEFNDENKNFNSINRANCFFTEISNLCVKNGVPKIDLHDHINLIAEKNCYHPAIEFIESKAWDGLSRLSDLLETIISSKQELANKLIYRWLISCVAALYLPEGIASEGALVLQGKQKVGKTYWLLKLVPEEFRHLVKEGVSVSVNNKDDLMKATNVWIAELGEIQSTFKKSDVDELKNFITRSYDEYREPFGRFSKKCCRRTIFAGSVNSQNFLADETGNRRFWTVPVLSINYAHTIDMQQLWAEIKVLYDQGESYRLSTDEQFLLNESNKDHECINPLKELLLNNYYWESPNRLWKTSTQIVQEMDLIPDKAKTNSLSNILRELEIESRKTKHGIQYSIPYKKSPHINN